ncbi:MAG TPA: EF-Tu/IF-2/RF-3 family GTPase [Candidatus Thermoplasmatota archaeon]|nr:EF-Tu/IF-2/RF-3 family GTPase [Candidatus Thermoplasmatota archaeon]
MKKAITVAVLGQPEVAKQLGKKSTESDITLYDLREGNADLTLMTATRYPEKPQSLSYVVQQADAALLVIEALTREIGEQILALDAAGVNQGLIVLRNYIQPEQVQPLLKGTTLENYAFFPDDLVKLRLRLGEFESRAKEGATRVPIDQHFNVKGVGVVVLGTVKGGPIKKHDNLRAFPAEKSALVRSIQVHDVDVDTAHYGERVGLALKNIEVEDLDRGFVLAPDGSMEIVPANGTIKARVRVTKFFKAGVKPDAVYFLGLGMQFTGLRASATAAAIPAGGAGEVEFTLQKSLAFEKGQRAVLWNLDDKVQRVVGSVEF